MTKHQSTLALLDDAKTVVAQYRGMPLTVRQIYYRLVVAGKITNCLSSYQRLVRILRDARLDGQVNFDDIEDKTREIIEGEDGWYPEPSDYFDSRLRNLKYAALWYNMRIWWGQENRVILLIEKQALQRIFQQITEELGVDLLVCRGYPSLTVLHDLAQRLDSDKQNHLLYSGDFDPSGKDIDRNIKERMSEGFGTDFVFERVAITREQIDQYQLPPVPAKESDARYRNFVEQEGVAWQIELDALDPPILSKIAKEAIGSHFDSDTHEARREELRSRKKLIQSWVDELFNHMEEP